MSSEDVIYLGVGRHVVAVSTREGVELWRCKLPSSSLLTLLVRDDAVYAGAAGKLFCLDPRTGEIRWRNPLKGLGTGVILFAGADASGAAGGQAAAQQAAMVTVAAGAAVAVSAGA